MPLPDFREIGRPALLVGCVALATGCGEAPGESSNDTASESVCPADDPDCDRIEEPCFPEAPDDPEVLGPSSSTLGLADALKNGKYQVWPKGRVPYKIGSTVNTATRDVLLAAMNEWQTKSEQRVRFEKATSADDVYVLVSEGSPKVEFVGYSATKISKLYLRDGEFITVTRHELGHVLGLEHEHQRTDRGNYIIYKPENIVADATCKAQFTVCSDCTLVNDYHIGSVMHYRSKRDLSGCRVDNKPVLLAKDGTLIDHDWVITKKDLLAIAELYGPPPGTSDAGTSTNDAAASGGAGGAESGGTAGASGASGAGQGGSGGDEVDAAASGGGSGGAGNASSGGADAGTKATTRTVDADDEGCSCRAAPRDSSFGWIVVTAMAALGRFRTRRTRFG